MQLLEAATGVLIPPPQPCHRATCLGKASSHGVISLALGPLGTWTKIHHNTLTFGKACEGLFLINLVML